MEAFDLVTWLSAAAVAVAAVAVIALAWRVPLHDALPLDEMLRRQGADPDREERLQSGEFAVAIGRCLSCNATRQCRDWLDSGKQAGFEAFCPNAKYVAHTARRHRSA